MFKRITIELKGPICNCKKYNLGWQILGHNDSSDRTLIIHCLSCKVQLIVPPASFVGSFILDQAYPECVLVHAKEDDEIPTDFFKLYEEQMRQKEGGTQ